MSASSSVNPEVRALASAIERATRIAVFTGAGISTESGIPDFRSPGGIWDKYKPIDFRDFMASEEARRESWRRKFATDEMMASASPNRGHRAVAKLVEAGKAASVITQNVDGLHQRSGVPDDKVIELHGNATYAKCLECGARHDLDEIRALFEPAEEVPNCAVCGGIVKTATVSFGQAMPEEEMRRATLETYACDLFLVLGSSLVVQPAASLPWHAARQGAELIILNRDETPLDAIAGLVIHDEIGPILGDAVGVN
jgi:NAD-dependent deacetylase